MAELSDMTSVYNNMPLYESSMGWQYSMRRHMQEIIPGLFLGPYSSALSDCHANLIANGITHIVCVRHKTVEAQYIKPHFNESTFNYLILDIADLATESIISHFPKVRKFIDEALMKSGKVLVHSNNGNSRSATLVVAYIMEKFALNFNEAFEYVKNRRGCIKPNDGFVAQLTEYEPIYRARQSLEQGASSESHRQKRKSEQLCEMVDVDLIQPPPSPSTDVSASSDCRPEEVHDISNLHRLWLLKSS